MRLLAWSGGLDSTFLLWCHLRDGIEVSTVAITLDRGRCFQKAQLDARNAQMEWFRERLGQRWDHRTIEISSRERETTWDIVWIAKAVAEGIVKGDLLRPQNYLWGSREEETTPPREWRRMLAMTVFDREFVEAGQVPPTIICPSIRATRAEQWGQMPAALRDLTITCRRPHQVGGYWEQCGGCHTCREIVTAGLPLDRYLPVKRS